MKTLKDMQLIVHNGKFAYQYILNGKSIPENELIAYLSGLAGVPTKFTGDGEEDFKQEAKP